MGVFYAASQRVDDRFADRPAANAAATAVPLRRCLDLFLECELLRNENTWYCPACKAHQDATKQISLWTLPEILVVHLKRFAVNRSSLGMFSGLLRAKLDTNVMFPLRCVPAPTRLRARRWVPGTYLAPVCTRKSARSAQPLPARARPSEFDLTSYLPAAQKADRAAGAIYDLFAVSVCVRAERIPAT